MAATDRLLAELEPLTHWQRVRRMVALGGDAGQRPTLLALAGGGVYERRLALFSVFKSRDAEVLRAASAHPSRSLAKFTAQLIRLCPDDALAAELLRAAPRQTRSAALDGLRKAGRTALLDAFIGEIAAQAPDELHRVLHFASPALAARLLPAVAAAGGGEFWCRFARAQPDAAAAHWRALLAADAFPDARLRYELSHVLDSLCETRPAEALALLTRAAALVPVAGLLSDRVLRLPGGARVVAAAYLTAETPPPRRYALAAVAAVLTPELRRGLVLRGAAYLPLQAAWLKRVPHAERRALAALAASQRDADGVVPVELLALCARGPREDEARRHLALPALATRPVARAPYASLLGFTAAEAVLAPLSGHPDPANRAAALAALVAGVRHERGALGKALELLKKRKNEQDPVRFAALTALAALPPAAWRAEDLPALDAVVRDALKAADLSMASVIALQRMLWRLLRTPHAGSAGPLLRDLIEARGEVHAPPPGALDRHTAAYVDELIAPLYPAWYARGRFDLHLQVFAAFGAHLCHATNARAAAERVAFEVKDPQTAEAARSRVELGGDPAWHRALVPRLLAKDESWGSKRPVLEVLSATRQDLLAPFLGQKTLRGRFTEGKTRLVPWIDPRWFWRWTPAQQASYGRGLEELTVDPAGAKRDITTKLACLSRLSQMDLYASQRLADLAQDGDEAVREGALRGLGRLDDGRGLPLLLAALGDDRARIAVFGIRRAVLAMPPAAAFALIAQVPLTRVTVAKEVLRLVGDVGGAEAMHYLQRAAARPLHRDVRLALLRGLWAFTERPEAWDLFDDAARDADGALCDGIVRLPAGRLGPAARGRFAQLMAVLCAHADPVVALAALRRLGEGPVADDRGEIAAALARLAAAPAPELRQAAVRAAVAMTPALGAAGVARFAAACVADRRAMRDGTDVLVQAAGADAASVRPLVGEMLARLDGDGRAVVVRVQLAGLLPVEAAVETLKGLAERGEMHAGALFAALGVMGGMVERARVEEGEGLEKGLGRSKHELVRRLGLAALQALAAVPPGWSAERLERLEVYRRDPAAVVGEAAETVRAGG